MNHDANLPSCHKQLLFRRGRDPSIETNMDTQRANESTIIAKVKGKTLVCYKPVLTHNNLIFVVLTTIL